MKLAKLLPLVLVASLTACESYKFEDNTDEPIYAFGTYVTYRMQIQNHFNGGKCVSDIKYIFEKYDAYADATKQREVTNVWSLNQTNEPVTIDKDFYNLLNRVIELDKSLTYFNPLVGSLSSKWKVALNLSKEYDHFPYALSQDEINLELAKINSSSLEIGTNDSGFYAQRKGEALLDLGGVAKGYALDMCRHYLEHHTGHTDDYLINAGNSSVLLGKNSQRIKVWKQQDYEEGVYVVKVTDIRNQENLRIYNSFVSTSGISEQHEEIDGKTYSHIINPLTGSAISNYDKIIVLNENTVGNGALGDALSTSLMMSSEEEIQKAEKDFGIKVVAVKSYEIVYQSRGVELYF